MVALLMKEFFAGGGVVSIHDGAGLVSAFMARPEQVVISAGAEAAGHRPARFNRGLVLR